jgi:hypothetical protein
MQRGQAVGSAVSSCAMGGGSQSPVGIGEMAVDRGAADAEGLGDRRHRVLPGRVQLLGHLELVGGHHRGPAATAATGPGGRQPGAGARADQVASELGQGGEAVEDQLAARGGGVDLFLQAAEPDLALGQAGDRVDQVAQGAAQSVQLPDDQGVAGAQLVQDLREDRAVAAAPLAVLVNTR